MKRFILIGFLLALIPGYAQDVKVLSSSAQISLLTCSPGEELYSLFGHSAFRVRDPQKHIDLVYNYGTFAFNEDFYFNFSMGRLNYRLSIQPFPNFMYEYDYYERGVVEQVLDLDSAQVQKIYEFLNWNFLPENRYYLYDFFYDNCSSKLGDVLEENLGPGLVWADLKEESEPSFRQLIDRYLIYHPWGDFGIDLGLGLPCDKVPNAKEYTFLPDKLMEAYDHAKLHGKPLISHKHDLLTARGLQAHFSLLDPIPLFWMLFLMVAIISGLGWRKKRLFRGLDVFLFVVTGALGALIFFLWFITDHTATANNFNMLWAWPTHILAIPLLFFDNTRKLYWLAYAAVLFISLIGFAFLPQMLHLATIPIMLAMLLRAIVNIKLRPAATVQDA